MHKTSSTDLLTLASIDPKDSECIQAFNELHKRYSKYVWNVSYKAAYRLDPNNAKGIAMVLSQNTFIDVHNNAGAFEAQSDDEDLDIKLWLAGIIQKKALQHLDQNNKYKKHIVFLEIIPDSEEPNLENNSAPDSFEKKLLKNALKTLSEKESSILLSWYNFYTDGAVRNVDKSVKENLAKQFNMKVDSLKQTKKRALDKVLNYINNHKKS